MDLACKDAGFAIEFGRRFGVPLRLASVMEQTFIEGRARYGGAAWSSMIVKLLEDAVGTPLRAPGIPRPARIRSTRNGPGKRRSTSNFRMAESKFSMRRCLATTK